MNTLSVALCQIAVTDDKRKNLDKAESMIVAAQKKGAQLVVLPEMFNCPYSTAFFEPFAEAIPTGESCRRLAGLAKKLKIQIVGGTIPEIASGKIYNTSPVFGADGKLMARHRKMHLFDVSLKGVRMKESDVLAAGRAITVFKTPFGPMGLAVCYDIRFPEIFRLMLKEKIVAVVMPGAFSEVTGTAHWHALLRMRAVDNQIYMIAASPARLKMADYKAYGHSLISDPWGEIIAEAGTGESLVMGQISRDRITDIRTRIPLLKHRRTDLYECKALLQES